MPTYLSPMPSALTPAATSFASVSARSLTLPMRAHASHWHQPPPSLGSTEMLSIPGERFICRRA